MQSMYLLGNFLPTRYKMRTTTGTQVTTFAKNSSTNIILGACLHSSQLYYEVTFILLSLSACL